MNYYKKYIKYKKKYLKKKGGALDVINNNTNMLNKINNINDINDLSTKNITEFMKNIEKINEEQLNIMNKQDILIQKYIIDIPELFEKINKRYQLLEELFIIIENNFILDKIENIIKLINDLNNNIEELIKNFIKNDFNSENIFIEDCEKKINNILNKNSINFYETYINEYSILEFKLLILYLDYPINYYKDIFIFIKDFLINSNINIEKNLYKDNIFIKKINNFLNDKYIFEKIENYLINNLNNNYEKNIWINNLDNDNKPKSLNYIKNINDIYYIYNTFSLDFTFGKFTNIILNNDENIENNNIKGGSKKLDNYEYKSDNLKILLKHLTIKYNKLLEIMNNYNMNFLKPIDITKQKNDIYNFFKYFEIIDKKLKQQLIKNIENLLKKDNFNILFPNLKDENIYKKNQKIPIFEEHNYCQNLLIILHILINIDEKISNTNKLYLAIEDTFSLYIQMEPPILNTKIMSQLDSIFREIDIPYKNLINNYNESNDLFIFKNNDKINYNIDMWLNEDKLYEWLSIFLLDIWHDHYEILKNESLKLILYCFICPFTYIKDKKNKLYDINIVKTKLENIYNNSNNIIKNSTLILDKNMNENFYEQTRTSKAILDLQIELYIENSKSKNNFIQFFPKHDINLHLEPLINTDIKYFDIHDQGNRIIPTDDIINFESITDPGQSLREHLNEKILQRNTILEPWLNYRNPTKYSKVFIDLQNKIHSILFYEDNITKKTLQNDYNYKIILELSFLYNNKDKTIIKYIQSNILLYNNNIIPIQQHSQSSASLYITNNLSFFKTINFNTKLDDNIYKKLYNLRIVAFSKFTGDDCQGTAQKSIIYKNTQLKKYKYYNNIKFNRTVTTGDSVFASMCLFKSRQMTLSYSDNKNIYYNILYDLIKQDFYKTYNSNYNIFLNISIGYLYKYLFIPDIIINETILINEDEIKNFVKVILDFIYIIGFHFNEEQIIDDFIDSNAFVIKIKQWYTNIKYQSNKFFDIIIKYIINNSNYKILIHYILQQCDIIHLINNDYKLTYTSNNAFSLNKYITSTNQYIIELCTQKNKINDNNINNILYNTININLFNNLIYLFNNNHTLYNLLYGFQNNISINNIIPNVLFNDLNKLQKIFEPATHIDLIHNNNISLPISIYIYIYNFIKLYLIKFIPHIIFSDIQLSIEQITNEFPKSIIDKYKENKFKEISKLSNSIILIEINNYFTNNNIDSIILIFKYMNLYDKYNLLNSFTNEQYILILNKMSHVDKITSLIYTSQDKKIFFNIHDFLNNNISTTTFKTFLKNINFTINLDFITQSYNNYKLLLLNYIDSFIQQYLSDFTYNITKKNIKNNIYNGYKLNNLILNCILFNYNDNYTNLYDFIINIFYNNLLFNFSIDDNLIHLTKSKSYIIEYIKNESNKNKLIKFIKNTKKNIDNIKNIYLTKFIQFI